MGLTIRSILRFMLRDKVARKMRQPNMALNLIFLG